MPPLNFDLTTAPIISPQIRLTGYYNQSTSGASTFASNRSYFSDGITRHNDLGCILQYTLEGCGETWIANRKYPVPKGHGFINILNRVDTGYRYPPQLSDTWHFFCFHFEGGNIRELFSELIGKFGSVFDLSASHESLLALSEQIERKRGNVYSPAEMNALTSRILGCIYESVGSEHDDSNRLLAELHELIERRVRQTDSIRFGVNEAADALSMSREHLSKLYRSSTGQTLKQYIDRRRIEYICELLFERGLSCTEAAALLGIEHPENLTAYFRRCTGLSPTKYRYLL